MRVCVACKYLWPIFVCACLATHSLQTMKTRYPSCPMQDQANFRCLLSCPACRRQRAAASCHFSLTDCLIALEAWTGGDVAKVMVTCGRQRSDVSLLDLIPEVLNADLVAHLKRKLAAESPPPTSRPSSPVKHRFLLPGMKKSSGTAQISVLARKFATSTSASSALVRVRLLFDEVLFYYCEMRCVGFLTKD